ncbi:hypothetical protein [Endozoicomonas sp. SESOKO3]|uniref:hypothetical protein n=2 Tax=unclassified Endozoicomonas TaxID=2644528 RepID=UPI00214858BB|nr:hypothetical protein [Endozoicomonas sp. SESOKO3]
MIISRRCLARLVAAVLLLQTLNLQAQNTTQPAPPSSTTSPPTVLCEALPGNTTGVQQRLKQYSELVRGRQCVVLSADPTEDLAELINRLPQDTVILLSSYMVPTMKPSPSVTPLTGKTPVNYLIGSQIVLKNGQDIIGAADNGFEVVIMPGRSYSDRYMVIVGDRSDFKFRETKDSNIRHVTFWPTRPDGSRSIERIVSATCYNRRLIIENNVFHLPNNYGVRLDCRQPLDASANDLRTGPGLLFANNTVKGERFNVSAGNFIPLNGLFVSIARIKHQSQQIAIVDNTFRGKMSEVGDLTLGPGSHIDIFRNTIDIDNTGTTYREYLMSRYIPKNAFTLTGIRNTTAEPPLFNLAGNQIRVRDAAIHVEAQLELALACNQLEGLAPWRQTQQKYSLKAADPLPLEGECEGSVNSTDAMATTSPPSTSRILNTWTTIVTPLYGLSNVEGQFYFDSKACPTVALPSDVMTTTTSAGTTEVTTALGVITTLTLLLNL